MGVKTSNIPLCCTVWILTSLEFDETFIFAQYMRCFIHVKYLLAEVQCKVNIALFHTWVPGACWNLNTVQYNCMLLMLEGGWGVRWWGVGLVFFPSLCASGLPIYSYRLHKCACANYHVCLHRYCLITLLNTPDVKLQPYHDLWDGRLFEGLYTECLFKKTREPHSQLVFNRWKLLFTRLKNIYSKSPLKQHHCGHINKDI